MPLRPHHLGMGDAHELRHAGLRMRIVAIRAGHAVVLVDRGVPGHRRRAGVATEAEVLPAVFLDLAVRIVAGRAVEAVGAANLVRAGDLLQLALVAVATVADSRRDRAEMVRRPVERREILLRADVSLAAARAARCRDPGTTLPPPAAEAVAGRRSPPASWWPAFPAARYSGRGGSRRRSPCSWRASSAASGCPRRSCSLRGNGGRLPPGPPGRPT